MTPEDFHEAIVMLVLAYSEESHEPAYSVWRLLAEIVRHEMPEQ